MQPNNASICSNNKRYFFLKSPSIKMYDRIQSKMRENSNDESYHLRSKIEGLEEVRNNENFGFIIEGGKDKGIFLNG